MNRIMFNWGLLLVALVFGTSAFHNPHHRHQHHNGGAQVDEIMYQTPDEGARDFQPASACNVQGIWYNSLGSELILNVSATGHITGEFRTAVERTPGAAGTGPGQVSGWTSSDATHRALSFSVLWRNGASVTAWAGQCHVCSGVEIIKTTWLLTSEVDTCDDHWSSNRIGQDDFTRFEQVPGPRRHLNIHTPSDFTRQAEQFREEILSQEQPGL